MPSPTARVRIVVGLALIPLTLALAWLGGVAVVACTALIALAGLWEFYRIAAAKGPEPDRLLGMCGAMVLHWDAWTNAGQAAAGIMAAVVMAAAALEIVRRRRSSALLNVATTVLGVLYVGWLNSHLILIRMLPATHPQFSDRDGMGLLLMAFIIPWCGDTAAYFTGRSLGVHKLIPRVSAGKTVEGSIGGLLGATAVMLAVRPLFFSWLSLPDCLVLGLAGSVISQTGDLVESLMKRDADIKDASRIVPGHGGVLDRFDSVLFAAPFVYYYVRIVLLSHG